MIAGILSALTSKIAGPIATAVAAVLLVLLVSTQFDLAGTKDDLATRTAERDAAQSDLKTCRSNTGTLKDALAAQDAEIKALEARGKTILAESAAAVTAARRENRDLERRIARLQSVPPTGNTVCERMQDTHRQVQEAFR